MAKGSANDERVLEELIVKLGEEFIAKHFEIRRDLKVQEAYHHAHATRAEVQEAARPFVDREIIKCAAPSLKVT
jgi:hypothetical protein